ncbi:hypothetical protein HOG21_08210 [bacterium]|jgi:hypothetical protein|nr:hypothetical protein [bacterium]
MFQKLLSLLNHKNISLFLGLLHIFENVIHLISAIGAFLDIFFNILLYACIACSSVFIDNTTHQTSVL